MKRIFLYLTGLVLISCNSNSDSSQNQSDTSQHQAQTGADTSATAAGQNHMEAMHDAMNSMMQDMKSMSPTGDPDHDFAMMMRRHHLAAMDMARAELEGGADAEMKQMAQRIIDDQQKEVAQLDRFLQNHQPSGNSNYGSNARGMMTKMHDMKMESRSLDAMFASMMIPHHRDGIRMAEAYLKEGKSQELKQLAQKIISTHPQEIQEMQQWLNSHKQ